MQRSKEYIDIRKSEAKGNLSEINLEIKHLHSFKVSPSQKHYGLHIDVVNDNKLLVRASPFLEEDPRSLNDDEANKLLDILKDSLLRRKEELEKIINA